MIFLTGIMKIKFILLISVILCFVSCDQPVNFGYPDILSIKEGKKLPTIIPSEQYIQEVKTLNCPHETTCYYLTIADHQLSCSDCNQSLEPPQPHIKNEYMLQGVTTLDHRAIRIYSSLCSVCGVPVEFLLSSNLYGEYIRELQNETQP